MLKIQPLEKSIIKLGILGAAISATGFIYNVAGYLNNRSEYEKLKESNMIERDYNCTYCSFLKECIESDKKN